MTVILILLNQLLRNFLENSSNFGQLLRKFGATCGWRKCEHTFELFKKITNSPTLYCPVMTLFHRLAEVFLEVFCGSDMMYPCHAADLLSDGEELPWITSKPSSYDLQTKRLFLKFLCGHFQVVLTCTSSLTLPWQPSFDSQNVCQNVYLLR